MNQETIELIRDIVSGIIFTVCYGVILFTLFFAFILYYAVKGSDRCYKIIVNILVPDICREAKKIILCHWNEKFEADQKKAHKLVSDVEKAYHNNYK